MNYPRGNYGVILVGADNSSNVVLHIKEGGIIRIDYLADGSPDPLASALERGAAEIILAPNQ